jgi:exopolysaccharide biosynthesis polyprenyl glycosylphosphotransferase
LLYALADVLLAILAFQGAYVVRQSLQLRNLFEISPPVQALLLGVAVLTLWGSASWFRVYERMEGASPWWIIREAARQSVTGFVALILFEFLLRLDLSRPFLILFTFFLWILLCLFRLNAGPLLRKIRREFGEPQYVMVVGTGAGARRLAEEIESSADYGLRLTGFLAEQPAAVDTIELQRSYPVRALSELPLLLREQVIDEIVFCVDSQHLTRLEEIFLLCDEEGVRTRVAVDFFPHVNSEVFLDRFGSWPLLTFSATPHDELRLLVKRGTDLLLALLALVFLAPFLALIALLIRSTSPGPAIFAQERCGLNGRRFRVYKFRSMCADAEERRADLEHLNERDGVVFKIRNDPRLTPLGRWLRKFSIDELPQLWNIVRGDMSIVGPRPAVPGEVEQYQRWQRRRLRMRPGLTCLWAVSGRDALDFQTWMQMDMQYIDNWSLALDWKIILKTIPRVLTGKGAS